MTMSWAGAVQRRLTRHGLGADPLTLVEAARAMAGAHAQVRSAAELSLGLRTVDQTCSGVRAALWTEHSLTKTYGPRGTVHLLATDDLPLWWAALSAIPPPSSAPRSTAMTPDQTEQVIEAIGASVEDAQEQPLTMTELSAEVVRRTGPWAGDPVMPAFQVRWPRWRQAITTAGHRGVLAFGPDRGREVTFTSPRRWLGPRPDPSPAAALDWLLRRYLYAYGPARPRDFAQWLAAPKDWADQRFAAAGDLQPVELEGHPAFALPEDAEADVAPATGVRLLPYFDAFVVGSHPRTLLYPGRAAERALSPTGQAGNYPVLLLDGQVAGVWHQKRSGTTISITVEPLRRLTKPQRRGLDDQVERLAVILESSAASLTVGHVAVGPHA